MGFFDKILGGKKEEELKQTIQKLQFNEVEDWIKQRKDSIENQISKESEPILNELSGILKEIKKRNEELASANMHKDVQQRIKSIVSSSKDNYVAGVRTSIEKLGDLDSLGAKEDITNALSTLQQLGSRYSERVYFGFPEEMKKLRKEMKNLAKISTRLEESIGNKKENAGLLDETLDKVRAINGELESIKELEIRIESAKTTISDLEKQKEGLDGEGESIKRSQRAADLSKSKEELATYVNRSKEIESIILNTLAPLKRVFKKYRRVAETGKYPPGNVVGYLDNPVGTFLGGDRTFEMLISNVKRALNDNGLELTSAEKDKILKKIGSINLAKMEQLRIEYSDLRDKIETLESQVSKLEISKDLEGLSRKAKSAEKSISEEKTRLDKTQMEVENKRKEVSQKEEELASKLSKFLGGKCEIIH